MAPIDSLKVPVRILLVEDDGHYAGLVATMLGEVRGASLDLRVAACVSEALDALGRECIDLVLLDLGLPDAAGLEGMLALQRGHPLTPIVIVTGTSDERLDAAAIQHGAQGYLVKDEISPALLGRTIRHAIERSRMTRQLEADRAAARHLATHDVLTGIPNRMLLEDRLAHAVDNARRSGAGLAVLLVDLNRFKSINDAFGHATGDEVLRCAAARLGRQIRRSDTLARLGGDEFALVLTNLQRDMDAARVAQKLIDSLARPITVGNEHFDVGASIGIASFPRDGSDAGTLLENADRAMYHAKRSGRSSYRFHSEEMGSRARERLETEQRLARALHLGELMLHFQPRVDLESLRIVGAEALLRWVHPRGGVLAPREFLPIAEETGQILAIGEWVLRSACATARPWVEAHGGEFHLSVNVSARQLRQVGFEQAVDRALAESGLRPAQLTVELTEAILVDGTGATERVLAALRERGVRISIDDFGQGHAALATLKRVPCDEIKIDRAFITGVADDARDATIASAIIALSKGLGLEVVAEGVEVPEQLEFLERHGCRTAQGYLFSTPLPADDFTARLARGLGAVGSEPAA